MEDIDKVTQAGGTCANVAKSPDEPEENTSSEKPKIAQRKNRKTNVEKSPDAVLTNFISFQMMLSKVHHSYINLYYSDSNGGKPSRKVIKFYNIIFQVWKAMEFGYGSWKVMENDYKLFFRGQQSMKYLE